MDRQLIITAAFLAVCVILLIIGKYCGWDDDDDKGFPNSRGRRK